MLSVWVVLMKRRLETFKVNFYDQLKVQIDEISAMSTCGPAAVKIMSEMEKKLERCGLDSTGKVVAFTVMVLLQISNPDN